MFGARVVVVDVSEHYTSPPTLPTNHKGSDVMSRNQKPKITSLIRGASQARQAPRSVGKRKGLREFILYENTQHSSPKPLARSALAASFMTILPSASSLAGSSLTCLTEERMEVSIHKIVFTHRYGITAINIARGSPLACPVGSCWLLRNVLVRSTKLRRYRLMLCVDCIVMLHSLL